MSAIRLALGILVFIACAVIIITLVLVLPKNKDGATDSNVTNNGSHMNDLDIGNNCKDRYFGHPLVIISTFDDHVEIYWNFTSSTEQCKTKYRGVLTTDTGTYREIYPETQVNLSRRFYCFTVTVTIEAEKSNYTQSISYTMPPVTGIVASDTNGTLTARWTSNPLEEQCHIIYEVTFKSKNTLKKFVVNKPTATTESLYCTNTTVNVIAEYGKIKGNDSNITIPESYPTSLPPIDDVSINVTASSAVISWKPPASVESCVNLYTVSARNEKTGVEAACQGTANCELNLSSFCPATQFNIKPTSPIEGEEITKRFVCTNNNPV